MSILTSKPIRYNPGRSNGEGCSTDNPEKCRGGDFNGKFGAVKVGKSESMFTKKMYTDMHLNEWVGDLQVCPLTHF